MGDPRGSWLPLGRYSKNNCGFADDYFLLAKQTKSDEGSKGESAVSLLVAVSKTRPALPVLAFDSETDRGFAKLRCLDTTSGLL